MLNGEYPWIKDIFFISWKKLLRAMGISKLPIPPSARQVSMESIDRVCPASVCSMSSMCPSSVHQAPS